MKNSFRWWGKEKKEARDTKRTVGRPGPDFFIVPFPNETAKSVVGRVQAWHESATRTIYCQLIKLVFVRSQEGRGGAACRARWRRKKIVFISFELFMTWNFTCRSLTRLDEEGWKELSLPLKPQSACFGSPWRTRRMLTMTDSPGQSGVLLICIMTLKAKMQPRTPLSSGHREADFPAASGATDITLRTHTAL